MTGGRGTQDTFGDPRQIAAILVGGQLVMAILAIIWFNASGIIPPIDRDQLGLAILAGFVLAGILIGVVLAIKAALPAQMAALDRTASQLWAGTGLTLSWPVIICLSVMAGVSEELFFRGALQYALAFHVTPLFGLLVASFVFGLGHALSWYYFLLTAFIGLLLGAVFWITGALLPIIIAHILYDIWAFRRLKRLIANH